MAVNSETLGVSAPASPTAAPSGIGGHRRRAIHAQDAAKRRIPITDVEQAIVERHLTLGIDLCALRNAAGNNREFARMARQTFDIDPARAALYARVARAYGDRRDITSRVNWKALVALATASEPVRLEFEERIVRGERISAADIKQRR